jgi:hypothetical protein
MSIFARRFLSDPGNDVLLQIESINIIDLTPPSAIAGIGTGTALLVGEFEDGPYATTTQVASPDDLLNTFGSFGYTYGGSVGQNPCARLRHSDGALAPEYWNGNGFVQLNAKKFAALLISRVDTRVGNVTVARLAYLTGAASFRYQLAAGQVLQLDLGAGPAAATFTATVATVTAIGGVYPTTFAGGQTLTLGFDDPVAHPNFTVTFLAADQSLAQVVARINQYAGFAFADSSGGQLRLTGLAAGSAAQVRVVSGSTGVLTQLGLTAATTAGTGNVANIAAVSAQEVALVVQAAIAGSVVEQDVNGNLRISSTASAGWIVVGAGTTALALGFLPGSEGTALGQPILVTGAGTYPDGFVGGETLTLQIDLALPAVTTTFVGGDTTLAAVVSRINAAFTAASQGAPVTADGAVRFYVVGPNPAGTITVIGASAAGVLTALGLTVGATVGTPPLFGSLPAGTIVRIPGGTQFVTTQSLTFASAGVSIAGTVQPAGATTFVLPIRHALDDGSGLGTGAGTITQVGAPPAIGAFSVVNFQIVTAALTETQLDAQYVLAIAATTQINTVAKTANIVWSARQSNAVRSALRTNAIVASAGGCFGRVVIVRPPMNTLEGVALSNFAQPGVGAYRDQRTVYTYPQANTFVPLIARVGVAGGPGFTPSGNVDVGADGFLASVLSQLNPEENCGQVTEFTSGVNGLETGANVQNFQIGDYTLFKAAGICALRIDDGVAIFQSDTTSVGGGPQNPLASLKRRRMDDFITDSISVSLKAFGKKLGTKKRKNAVVAELNAFLNGLISKNDLDNQRIDSFDLDPKSGNTLETLGLGLFRIIIDVRLLSSLDSFAIQVTVGETVITAASLAAAA